jgi:hypothetical protein
MVALNGSVPPLDAWELQARIAEMLAYGASQLEIVALAQRTWKVSRHVAQEAVREVRERLAAEAGVDDQLVALRIGQLRRDKLLGLALRYVSEKEREGLDPPARRGTCCAASALRDKSAGQVWNLSCRVARSP